MDLQNIFQRSVLVNMKNLLRPPHFCVSIGFKGVKYGKTGENHTRFAISQERLIVIRQVDHNMHISIANFNIEHPRLTLAVKIATYFLTF